MSDPVIATAPPGDDPHYAEEAIRVGLERVARHVPDRYRDAVVTVPEVANWVRAVVLASGSTRGPAANVRNGPSLLILGQTGTGKTHEAFGALRALSASGAFCSWEAATAADIYARMRPRHGVDSEAEFAVFANAPVLFIDDLGAAKNSDWTEEVNYRLINHRYERMRPTLVTSNVPPKDLGDAVGGRVASRLTEMATRVALKGTDRRLGRRLGVV